MGNLFRVGYGTMDEGKLENPSSKNVVNSSNKKKEKDSKNEPLPTAKGVVLVGTSGAGKTTIFSQCQKLFGKWDHDNNTLRVKTYQSLIDSLYVLVRDCEKLSEKKLQHLEARPILTKMHDEFHPTLVGEMITKKTIGIMKHLWTEEPVIQEAIQQKHLIPDYVESCEYWMDNINRITDLAEYYVTFDDVLNHSVKTTGVSTIELTVNNVKLRLVDVGGDKEQRLGWDNILQHASAVVWVSSLSEFDQTSEDHSMIKMKETLVVLQNLWKTSTLANVPFFFVFTKRDVFAQKLQKNDLSLAFGEAQVPQELQLKSTKLSTSDLQQQSIQYVQQMFTEALLETKVAHDKVDIQNHSAVVNALETSEVREAVSKIFHTLVKDKQQQI